VLYRSSVTPVWMFSLHFSLPPLDRRHIVLVWAENWNMQNKVYKLK